MRLTRASALVVVVLAASFALADNLTFSIGPNQGYAALTTSDLGGGEFLVTGGTVTVTAGPDAGLWTIVPGGPGMFGIPGFNVDNVLYPAGDPVLDVYGLGLVAGGTYLNIWGNGPGNYSFYGPGVAYDGEGYVGITEGNAPVPEPGTLALLGSGAVALSAALRRSIFANHTPTETV